MKVWGLADPRALSREHLLTEHSDVHALITTVQEVNGMRARGEGLSVFTSVGWSNHPEAARFYDHFREVPQARLDGLDWLYVRHEFLRCEMARRWPENHAGEDHPTPVPDLFTRSNDAGSIATMYEQGGVESERFAEWVTELGFPPTSMDYDTPWDRDFDGDRGEYVASWEG